MNIGDTLHGFTLTDRRPLPETGGDGLYFIHEKSGARLLYLANDDDNKTFGIGFRTPSANSTGVAHILEHSVLNGSKKYRTKEPFMDLAKSSLATFLNAMTFSDKTIYPVASRNDKDFAHLMDVYLDAVFNPSIYVTKEIFLQEGWHYHLERPEDPITYRGVVYNEMRGALSGADEQVVDAVLAALYPDTIYGFESGGDPYEIPTLTYEAFLNFHRALYHPSNSYLFLYGKMDLAAVLARINNGYLSRYSKADVKSTLALQAPFAAPKEVETTFAVASGDETEGKDQLVYSVIFGTRTKPRDLFLADLFADALIDSQAGPLRKALLAAGLGADVVSMSSDGIQIPFGIILKDTDAVQKDAFVQVIEDTVRELIAEGIPQELLLSSLNKIEFGYREASGYATRGIIYYINAFESWLYDESPFDALAYDAPLAELRQDILDGKLEAELQTRFLDNPHKVIVTARPDPGKNERRDAEVEAQLAAYKDSLSEEDIQNLINATERLLARQNRQDSAEERATLPVLKLSDIDTAVTPVPREERNLGGARVLLHDLFTSGIVYLDVLFDASHIAADELRDYSLLTALIGALDTSTRNYSELVTDEYLYTGGISLNPTIYSDYNKRGVFYPRLALSTRLLATSDPDKVFALMRDTLCNTIFDDTDRIHEVIQMLRLRMEMGIFQKGHSVVSARAKSYLSQQAKYGEALSGLDFLFYLQELDKNFDATKDAFIARLKSLYARLLTSDGLLVSITGAKADCETFFPALESFIAMLPKESYPSADFLPAVAIANEGIQSAAGVQYVAQAADLTDYGVSYSGKLEVLSNLLSYEYLYNEVRAKGGAYGQGIRFSRNGFMSVYSYRDPNLSQTFDVYAGLADWLRDLDFDDERLRPFIIGTMNRFNPALTARAKGVLDLTFVVTGQTFADVERVQSEALDTDIDDLRGYADALGQAIAANIRCVLGSAARIQAEADLFDRVLRLESGE